MPVADLAVPEEDGGLIADPPVRQWAGLLGAVTQTVGGWRSMVLGRPLVEIRDTVRADSLRLAREYSTEIGVHGAEPAFRDGVASPLIVTGHQPTLFHPGVWAKHLLVDRIAARVGGIGLDVVVDSDTAGRLCAAVPERGERRELVARELCMLEEEMGIPFESLPAPSAERIGLLLGELEAMLSTLEAPGPGRCASTWRESVAGAHSSGSLADFLTSARRRYESPLGTAYLELPISRLAGTDGFLLFALDACARGPEFRQAYNRALDRYRDARKMRNPANPFPDLEERDGLLEMPFWVLTDDGRREPMFVGQRPGEVEIMCGSCREARIPTQEPAEALAVLREARLALRPKALALTMFMRLFLADLFVHGVGGGKYDAVTDVIMRECYGLEPPRYAIASLTLRLPLGAGARDGGVDGADANAAGATASRLQQRLSALAHNPDRFLDELEKVPEEALAPARRKRELIDEIGRPGADKKAIGARIRAANEELRHYVRPLVEATRRAAAEHRERERAAAVARRRDYPYLLFEPREVARALAAAFEED